MLKRCELLLFLLKKVVRFTKAGTLSGNKPAYKKAIVDVRGGESIDFYANL